MNEAPSYAPGDHPFERLDELLVGRALGDLDRREQIELDALLGSEPSLDRDDYERIAATLDLALDGREVTMTDTLREKLQADADCFFGTRATLSVAGGVRRSSAPARKRAWQGLATAAVLLLLVGVAWSLWSLRPLAKPAAPDGAGLRSTILASGDYVRWDWVATGDPTVGALSGDVVWSPREQTGTLRIGGLVANDPREFQYQLWIFDESRDERFPVDGGVFDIADRDDEVIVPIDAKLPVDRPYLFAITVERPGGVVVSSRERIAILARAPAEEG